MGSISVDNLYENVCNILKTQGRVENISKSFSEISHDKDRVNMVYNLLTEMKLLPSFRKVEKLHKNAVESIRLRNEGNKQFKKKDDSKALKLYTQSIMFAPLPQMEGNDQDILSLGFANRSAVLFVKGQFNDCIKDIDLAFENGYPNKLKYKLLERKAKCYQQLGNYIDAEKCLVEALEYLPIADNLSDEKRHQIERDIMNAQSLLKMENISSMTSPEKSQELPECSFEQHPHIPSASSAMRICYSQEMGRFVEAAKNIKPGDILLVEKPYASVLLPEFYASHCSQCLRRSWAPVPCFHCSMVVYCSPHCRDHAWETNHKVECPILPILKQLDAGKFCLLALRIVLLASNCGYRLSAFMQELEAFAQEEVYTGKGMLGFDVDGFYRSDAYGPIYHLVGNSDTRSAGDLFRRAVTAACVLDCLQKMSNFFETCEDQDKQVSSVVGGVILRHLQNLPCNAHEVTEYVHTRSMEGHHVAESIEIGAAAYATLSLLNHGCDPGVVRHSVCGDFVVLRALKPLQEGEQLLDNYGQHYALHPRMNRQNHLRSQYHFSCNCEPCSQDWPCYPDLPSTSPIYLCLKCRSKLPCHEKAVVVVCLSCGEETNILQLQQELLSSSKNFLQLLTKVLEGNELSDETPLVEHLLLLDSRVARPWKEYSDCQETLKQCFNLQGNYYCI